MISRFAYSANQGRTLIVYGMDYWDHIEDVFLLALSLFFSGLTARAFAEGLGEIEFKGLKKTLISKKIFFCFVFYLVFYCLEGRSNL